TNTFDVVTCINVLYAVVSPGRTLNEIRRVLKPSGTLIVSSPIARPRMSSFVREQAQATGRLATVPLLIRLSVLTLFNVLIFRRGERVQYHFMDLRAAQSLLGCQTLNPAYAGLNWFARLTQE